MLIYLYLHPLLLFLCRMLQETKPDKKSDSTSRTSGTGDDKTGGGNTHTPQSRSVQYKRKSPPSSESEDFTYTRGDQVLDNPSGGSH